MADLKKLLHQGILPQVFIALIAIVGVSQLVNSLSASADKGDESVKTGPRGAAGPKGDMGLVGPKGDTGDSGVAGATGKAGVTGKAGATGNEGKSGATGAAGPAGAVGPAGPAGAAGTFSASYGQLSLSEQTLDMTVSNEWLPIPFSATGPSSNVTVSTTSPAKMTVGKTGVYQVNAAVYLVGEDADEGWFFSTDYKLGLKINDGATTAVSTLHAEQADRYSFTYNNIVQLSAGDTIEFYMTATNTDSFPYTNHVTLEDSLAYVMQISN